VLRDPLGGDFRDPKFACGGLVEGRAVVARICRASLVEERHDGERFCGGSGGVSD